MSAQRAMSRFPVAVIAILSASGCSTIISRPPAPTVELPPAVTLPPPPAELPPDAVPRAEPRSRYGNPPSYEVFGRRYFVLDESRGFRERGVASWYGPGFHGQRTSSGEPYDMYGMTAAHKTLPLPAYVRVENLANGRSVIVRVNDRGPFVGERIIDLSYAAASKLDMLRGGTAPVAIEVLDNLSPETDSVSPLAVSTTAATPTTAGQHVQAGAFGSRENAQRFIATLQRYGFSGLELQQGTSVSGATLYRVRIGPVTSAAEADDLIERLALAGVPDARIAPPPAL